MALQTITYSDKSFLNENSSIADANKVNDTDMNEIKSVVNNNASELTPVILFENANGDSGDLTLNDSIENYSFYEIYYSREGNGYNSIRMSTEYLTNITLITSFFYNSILRYYMANISLANTTLTRNYSKYINFTGNNALNFGDESSLYIYKILGYK